MATTVEGERLAASSEVWWRAELVSNQIWITPAHCNKLVKVSTILAVWATKVLALASPTLWNHLRQATIRWTVCSQIKPRIQLGHQAKRCVCNKLLMILPSSKIDLHFTCQLKGQGSKDVTLRATLVVTRDISLHCSPKSHRWLVVQSGQVSWDKKSRKRTLCWLTCQLRHTELQAKVNAEAEPWVALSGDTGIWMLIQARNWAEWEGRRPRRRADRGCRRRWLLDREARIGNLNSTCHHLWPHSRSRMCRNNLKRQRALQRSLIFLARTCD